MKREGFINLWYIFIKNWIIISFILVCWIISFGIGEVDCNSKNYILSSISQGLAALFGLVFTISLVIVQIAMKYSKNILKKISSKRIILLMGLFILGIILPLIGMKIKGNWSVDISIALAGTCSILLIPYYLYFKNLIDPAYLLNELSKEAHKAILIKKEIPSQAFEIENMLFTAYKEKDYYIFENCLLRYIRIFIELNEYIFSIDIIRSIEKIYILSKDDDIGVDKILNSLRISIEECINGKIQFPTEMI